MAVRYNRRCVTLSLQLWDSAGLDQVQGFIQLVHDGDFVGVVCKTPSAVDAAMAKVKVTWRLQQPINQNEIDEAGLMWTPHWHKVS